MHDDPTTILAVYGAIRLDRFVNLDDPELAVRVGLTGARISLEVRAGATNGSQHATVPIKRDDNFIAPRRREQGRLWP